MDWSNTMTSGCECVPKGMRQVLKERGINTKQMEAEDMHTVLSNHKDFRTEKTVVESFPVDRGQKVSFLPKFDYELNPIERVWGQAKVLTRKYSNSTVQCLRNTIRPAYMAPEEQYNIGLLCNSAV